MNWFGKQTQHNEQASGQPSGQQQSQPQPQSTGATLPQIPAGNPARSGGVQPNVPGAPPPSAEAITAALHDFIAAPNWTRSRDILVEQHATLLTLEACLELVRQVGHASQERERNLLSLHARLLLIAYGRGVDTAWRWLEERRERHEQQQAALQQLVGLPQQQAVQRFGELLEQMPPEDRDDLMREFQAAFGENSDNQQPHAGSGDNVASGSGGADDNLSTQDALLRFLQADNWPESFDLLARHQRALLTGEAARLMRGAEARAHQEGEEEAARHFALHAQILEDAQREGVEATRRKYLRNIEGGNSTPASSPKPQTGSLTQISHLHAPTPSESEKQMAEILLAQPGISDILGADEERALRAWLGYPGYDATNEEKAQARLDLHKAMEQ